MKTANDPLLAAKHRMECATENLRQAAFGKVLDSNKLIENVIARKNGWERDYMTLHSVLPFNQSQIMTELLDAMKHLARTEKRERDKQDMRDAQRKAK